MLTACGQLSRIGVVAGPPKSLRPAGFIDFVIQPGLCQLEGRIVMESFDYVPRCNFCARDISQVSRMVAGEECHVCSDCVDGLHELVHSPQNRLADGPTYSNVASLEFFRPRADRH